MELLAPLIIAVVVIAAFLLYLSRTAKRLRQIKIEMDKDWSDIELLLKERQDELPRLIQTCRSYMVNDEKTLELVRATRAQSTGAVTLPEKAQAAAAMNEAIERLLAVASRYPDLQKNSAFGQIQARVCEIEERIAERRDLYNSDVCRFNARLKAFPSSIPARIAKIQPRPPFIPGKGTPL